MVGLGIVLLGSAFEMKFEFSKGCVVVLDQTKIDLHALAGIGFFEGFGDTHSVGLVGDLRGRWLQVVLMMSVLDMGEEVGSATNEMEPSSEEISGGSHLGRIDISLRKVPASQQCCDLEGIDLVVLGLTPVDGLHVESVAQDELDALFSAQIREPVPGEDALDGHDEVFSEGLDGDQEVIGSTPHVLVKEDLALSVKDAEVHRLGVQIDATVVSMGLRVESHGSSLGTVGWLLVPTSLLRVE
jgi:hypothetical protein